jgi:hypothetical protein
LVRPASEVGGAHRLLEAARVAVIPTPVRLAEAAARVAAFASDQHRLLPRVMPPAAAMPTGVTLPADGATLDEAQSKRCSRRSNSGPAGNSGIAGRRRPRRDAASDAAVRVKIVRRTSRIRATSVV